MRVRMTGKRFRQQRDVASDRQRERLLRFFILQAVGTGAVKIGDMSDDVSAEFLRGNVVNRLQIQILHIHVHDLSAGFADKMVMGLDIGIEAVWALAGRQLLNLAKICKERQVAVDRAETDVREFLADIHVYGVCRGVIITGLEKCHDGLSLFAVFDRRHIAPPFITIIITVFIIMRL